MDAVLRRELLEFVLVMQDQCGFIGIMPRQSEPVREIRCCNRAEIICTGTDCIQLLVLKLYVLVQEYMLLHVQLPLN